MSEWMRVAWASPNTLPPGFSHLSLPLIVQGRDGQYLLFANSRDNLNRSHVLFTEVQNLSTAYLQSNLSWRVLIRPGKAGHFDESGIVLSDLWWDEESEEFHGYVFGWRLRHSGGWFNSIGSVRISHSMDLIEVRPNSPVSLDEIDPISVAYPARLRGTREILYCSTQSMNVNSGLPEHYVVHSLTIPATSKNLVANPRSSIQPGTFAYSRPFGFRTDLGDHLWVSARGDNYSLRHLFRPLNSQIFQDGNPTLNMEAGLSDQESLSVCYASIFSDNGRYFLLHNGDNFGATGFGVSVLENEGALLCV